MSATTRDTASILSEEDDAEIVASYHVGLGGLGAVLLLAFAVGMSGDAIPSV